MASVLCVTVFSLIMPDLHCNIHVISVYPLQDIFTFLGRLGDVIAHSCVE